MHIKAFLIQLFIHLFYQHYSAMHYFTHVNIMLFQIKKKIMNGSHIISNII